MDVYTKTALVSIDDMLGDMERLFIIEDNKKYRDFIQHKIAALLTRKNWTFKVADKKTTRCPYDDVVLIHNDDTFEVLGCVQGMYPYTGNRQFLNQLETVAHEPTTNEQDAYAGVQQGKQEENANLRLVHDALLNVSRQLGRYRVKYGIETTTGPNHVSAIPRPIHIRPTRLCGAITKNNTYCKRLLSSGKSTCCMH
jgi:hypothetical protein